MAVALSGFLIKGSRRYEVRAGYWKLGTIPTDSDEDSPVSFYRVYLNGELQNPYTYKTLESAMEDVAVNYG